MGVDVHVYLEEEVDAKLRDRIRRRGDLSRIVNEALKAFEKYMEHPFFPFFKAMIKEYDKHTPIKGESWKQCSMAYLLDRMAVQFEDMQNRDDEDFIVNIGNYAAMLWINELRAAEGLKRSLEEAKTKPAVPLREGR